MLIELCPIYSLLNNQPTEKNTIGTQKITATNKAR